MQTVSRSRHSFVLPCVAALVSGALSLLTTPAHAQTMDVLNKDWENPSDAPYGYAQNGATATQANTAGVGVGGSRGAVLTTTFFAGHTNDKGGIQTTNFANPNTTPVSLSDVIITFDARITTGQVPAPVQFYVETWTGIFVNYDGGRRINFLPSSSFQTFSFAVSDMSSFSGDVDFSHLSIQASWQVSQVDGYGVGTHVLTVDNLRITVPSTAPEPATVALLTLGTGVPMLVRGGIVIRRRKA